MMVALRLRPAQDIDVLAKKRLPLRKPFLFYGGYIMKFSVNYKSSHKNLADEIRCDVDKLGYLFNFIKDNPGKRVNIIFSNNTLDTAKIY